MQLEPRLEKVAEHLFHATEPLIDAIANSAEKQQARAAIAAIWQQLSPADYRTLTNWVNHWNDTRAERVIEALMAHPHFDALSPDDQNRAVAAVLFVTYPRLLH